VPSTPARGATAGAQAALELGPRSGGAPGKAQANGDLVLAAQQAASADARPAPGPVGHGGRDFLLLGLPALGARSLVVRARVWLGRVEPTSEASARAESPRRTARRARPVGLVAERCVAAHGDAGQVPRYEG
jgi:hypothetical protein